MLSRTLCHPRGINTYSFYPAGPGVRISSRPGGEIGSSEVEVTVEGSSVNKGRDTRV